MERTVGKAQLMALGLIGLLFVEQTTAMKRSPDRDSLPPLPFAMLVEGQPPPLYLFDPTIELNLEAFLGGDPITRFERAEALTLVISQEVSTRIAEAIAYQLSWPRYFGFLLQVVASEKGGIHLAEREHVCALDVALNLFLLGEASPERCPTLWGLYQQKLTHALNMPNNPSVLDPYTLFMRDRILAGHILELRRRGVRETSCISVLLAHALAAGGDRNRVGRVRSRVRGIRGAWAIETQATFPVWIVNGDRIERVDRRILFVLRRFVDDDITHVHLATAFPVFEEESRIVDLFSRRSTPSDLATFLAPELEEVPPVEGEEDPTIGRMLFVQDVRNDTFDILARIISGTPADQRKSFLLRAWYHQCLLARDGLSLGRFIELAIVHDTLEIVQDIRWLVGAGALLRNVMNLRSCACHNPFVIALRSRSAPAMELLSDLFPEFICEEWKVFYCKDKVGSTTFDLSGTNTRGWSFFKTTLPGVAVLMDHSPSGQPYTPIPPCMESFFTVYRRAGGQFFFQDRNGFVSPIIAAVLDFKLTFFREMLRTNTDLRNLTEKYNFGRTEFKIFFRKGSMCLNGPQTLQEYVFDLAEPSYYGLVRCAILLEHSESLGFSCTKMACHFQVNRASFDQGRQLGFLAPHMVVEGLSSLQNFVQACESKQYGPAEIEDLVQNGYIPLFLLRLQERPWNHEDPRSFLSLVERTPKRPEMVGRFTRMKTILLNARRSGRVQMDDALFDGTYVAALDTCIAECSPPPATAVSTPPEAE
ncbi:MAG: hypothetical protein LBJ70_00960 [Holosporales bacterium]|nr:hypothetical protein [Holosporales bacterium]